MEWFDRVKAYLIRPKEKRTRSQQLLGDEATINAFGNLWENYGDQLMVAGGGLVFQYVEKANFTPEQLVVYKMAIGQFGELFKDAYLEVEAKRQKKTGKG